MPDGPSAAGADAMLTALVADAAWVQLHTGDPGTAGTSNVSSVTTRESVTWGSASITSRARSASPNVMPISALISFWSEVVEKKISPGVPNCAGFGVPGPNSEYCVVTSVFTSGATRTPNTSPI